MTTLFHGIEIFIAVVLIAILVLQARGGGVGGIFGGWGSSSPYRTRRGLERTLFRLTIVMAVLFVIIAMLCATLT
jgi:preprotein translocase subunit SecG